MKTPLGHDRCDHCQSLSDLYERFPSCVECAETTCPACDVPSARTEDEAHKTRCRTCHDETAALLAETPTYGTGPALSEDELERARIELQRRKTA